MTILVNPEDRDIWAFQFNVTLNPHAETMHVFADHEGDALDYAVDYADEQGYEGYFVADEDIYDLHDVVYAGNASRALLSHEITIVDVTGDLWV